MWECCPVPDNSPPASMFSAEDTGWPPGRWGWPDYSLGRARWPRAWRRRRAPRWSCCGRGPARSAASGWGGTGGSWRSDCERDTLPWNRKIRSLLIITLFQFTINHYLKCLNCWKLEGIDCSKLNDRFKFSSFDILPISSGIMLILFLDIVKVFIILKLPMFWGSVLILLFDKSKFLKLFSTYKSRTRWIASCYYCHFFCLIICNIKLSCSRVQ